MNSDMVGNESSGHELCVGNSVWEPIEGPDIKAFEATLPLQLLVGIRGMFGRKDVWDLGVVDAWEVDSDEVTAELETIADDPASEYYGVAFYVPDDGTAKYKAVNVKFMRNGRCDAGLPKADYVTRIYNQSGEPVDAERSGWGIFDNGTPFFLNVNGLGSNYRPD